MTIARGDTKRRARVRHDSSCRIQTESKSRRRLAEAATGCRSFPDPREITSRSFTDLFPCFAAIASVPSGEPAIDDDRSCERAGELCPDATREKMPGIKLRPLLRRDRARRPSKSRGPRPSRTGSGLRSEYCIASRYAGFERFALPLSSVGANFTFHNSSKTIERK